MKKASSNKKGMTAAKIIAGVAATVAIGCTVSRCNINGCVYGPPPDDTDDTTVTSNMNEDVYGPPEDFTTESNENEAVYGPPEDFTAESKG